MSLIFASNLIYNRANQQWLEFAQPVRVIEVYTLADVLPALEEIDNAVKIHGYWAVGYMAYEAAPAFDKAMVTHPPLEGFPLLWFGLYHSPARQLSKLPLPRSRASSWAFNPSQLKLDQSQSDYETSIHRIKEYIAAGSTYQVNYTTRVRAKVELQPFELFHHLIRSQGSGYSAYLNIGTYTICSASPELFFNLNRTTLYSKPMKGTAPRGRTLAEDQAHADWLYHSEKNRAENVMIVDMVRNDMGRIAQTGSVQVPHLFEIERYPTLLQMTSTVECQTHAALPEIFTALFPCASITGAPKISTMQIIQELEMGPRGVYTGTIGFIAPDRRAQFNVAIRTLVVDCQTSQAAYGIGSGIVWDSEPVDEYHECLLKSRVLTMSRPDFDLFESLLWSPEGGYFLLERHLKRLQDSAEYFNFPFDAEKIRKKLAENIPSHDAHKVRLLLNPAGDISLEQASIPRPSSTSFIPPGSVSDQDCALRATLAPSAISSADVFLYHKTTHRAVYDQVRTACPGFDEVLLWNERGEITEFLTSNVVVRVNDEFLTPPITCGLLGGTLRSALLEQGTLTERVILREELPKVEAVWAINSIRGWRRVRIEG